MQASEFSNLEDDKKGIGLVQKAFESSSGGALTSFNIDITHTSVGLVEGGVFCLSIILGFLLALYQAAFTPWNFYDDRGFW